MSESESLKPKGIFHYEPEEYPLIHKFVLPYIFQPEGQWDLLFAEQQWHVQISHRNIPTLIEIVTAIVYDENKPAQVKGPKELLLGISEIEVHEIYSPQGHQTSFFCTPRRFTKPYK